MASDKPELHRIPADEIPRHYLSTSCPCRPVVITPPDNVRVALGRNLVPAVSHRNAIERALEDGIPDALPLDLYDPTV